MRFPTTIAISVNDIGTSTSGYVYCGCLNEMSLPFKWSKTSDRRKDKKCVLRFFFLLTTCQAVDHNNGTYVFGPVSAHGFETDAGYLVSVLSSSITL